MQYLGQIQVDEVVELSHLGWVKDNYNAFVIGLLSLNVLEW